MNAQAGLVVVATLCAALSSVRATECVWEGGSGDWTAKENWRGEIVPSTGDKAILRSAGEPITVNIDVEGVSLDRLWVEGSGSVTLTGHGYTLTGYSEAADPILMSALENDVFTNAAPLTLGRGSGTTFLMTSNTIEYVGSVTITGTAAVRPRGKTTGKHVFRSVVDGPSARIEDSNATYFFYGPVRLAELRSGTGSNGHAEIYSTGNDIPILLAGYYKGITAWVAGAFPTNAVLTWKDTEYGPSDAFYDFYGDQVVNRIDKPNMPIASGSTTLNEGMDYIRGYNNATLTLRATESCVSCAAVKNSCSLAWDPLDDHTIEFRGRENTLNGTLRVNRGTMILGRDSVISKMATFKNATGLYVADGAVFKIEDGGENPFTDGKVDAEIAGSGSVYVPEGVTVAFKSLAVGGVRLESGATYMSAPWLSGGGTVKTATVATPDFTYWQAPADGNWSEEANWTEGVPAADKTAYLTANTASYAVTVDEDPVFRALVANTLGAFSTTLRILTDRTFDGFKSLTLGCGAKIDVVAGKKLTLLPYAPTSPTETDRSSVAVKLEDGAEISVGAGSTLTLTGGVFNARNGILTASSSDPSVTTKVSVVGGTLDLAAYVNFSVPVRIGEGALLHATDSTVLFRNVADPSGAELNYSLLTSTGGEIVFDGTTSVTNLGLAGKNSYVYFGSGRTRFEDDAQLVFASGVQNFACSPSAENTTAELEFLGSSAICKDPDRTSVNTGVKGSTARMLFDTDAPGTMSFGGYLLVGLGDGTGELRIKKGSYKMTTYTARIGGQSTYTSTYTATHASTGVVTVANGATLELQTTIGQNEKVARSWIGSNGPRQLPGLNIGDAPGNKAEDACYYGRLEIDGGTVRNTVGFLTIGLGLGAKGEVILKDGTFKSQYAGQYTSSEITNVVVIGAFDGEGAFRQTGGAFETIREVYVGGATTNQCHRNASMWGDNLATRHNAKGLLSVRGGTFSTESILAVGEDGSGTVEVGGTGSITAKDDIVLANGTRSVLRYVMDADGKCGSICSTDGDVRFSAGSVIQVDVSAYEGDRNRHVIFDLPNAVDADEATIELIGAKDPSASLRLHGGRLVYLAREKGMVLILR